MNHTDNSSAKLSSSAQPITSHGHNCKEDLHNTYTVNSIMYSG